MSWRIGRMLRLSRRVYGLVRVLYETLGSTDRARNVETAVEVAQVLRGLEGFFERRLSEAQG